MPINVSSIPIYNQNQIQVGDHALEATKIHIKTSSPGGCSEATWEVTRQDPYFSPSDIHDGNKIEFYDDTGLFWRGRLESRKAAISFRHVTWGLTALGYSASARDRVFTTSATFGTGGTITESDGHTAVSSSERIVARTRDLLCPFISGDNANIYTTGRGISAKSQDFISKNAQDVWSSVIKMGDSNNNPLLWHVWEGPGGSTGLPVLELISRPSTAAYTVSLDSGTTADLEWTFSRLYNRIIVQYKTPAGVVSYSTSVDADSMAGYPIGYGVTRDLLVQTDLVGNANDAAYIGQTLLNRYKAIHAISSSIKIPSTVLIEDENGGIVKPWRVRSGKIMRIRELKAGASSLQEYEFFIQQTDWDNDAQMLAVTPEGAEDTTAMLARFIRQNNLS